MDETEQHQQSPAFNAAVMLIAQGLVALITVIVLYFWQMLGPGCADNQCYAIWVVNTVARWMLVLLFIGTLIVTITLRATGRPPVRVPLTSAIISVAVAVASLALVWFLPGGVGSV